MNNSETKIDQESTANQETSTNVNSSLIEDSSISQDSRNKAIIVWIGCLFTGIIQFVMLFIDQDDDFMQQHAKEASNWAITSLIVYFVSSFLFWLILPIFFIIAVGIMHVIFCILAAIKASNGEEYKIPVPMLRLIK